jgi:hypothetical protein
MVAGAGADAHTRFENVMLARAVIAISISTLLLAACVNSDRLRSSIDPPLGDRAAASIERVG